ncbi:MAG TPA: hypothetical protein VIK80_03910 [Flavihumibacter sp.]|jgi:hypothetical protein
MLKKILTILSLALAFVLPSMAQEVILKASVDRDKILIGEHIRMKLYVEIPTATPMGWFHLDTLPHFHFINKGKVDTQHNATRVIFKQDLIITSFDSGRWAIPQLGLTVGNKRFLTDSILVSVDYSPMDPNQPYHDIKDIIEVPATDNDWINYLIAALTALAIAVLSYLWWRKKKPQVVATTPAAPKLSPLEQAMKELKELQEENLPQRSMVKTYFIRLNDITRNYFRNRGLVTAPDALNETLVLRVKNDLPPEHLSRFAQALRLADAVKFARYAALPEEQEEALEAVRKAITIIDEVEYKKPGT